MVRGGNSLPTIGEGYFTSFGAKDLFKKAELVKGIWTTTGISGANTNARSWVVRCEPNTTYVITRKATTNRGQVASFANYPTGHKDKIQTNKEVVNNTCTITTGSASKYLLIFFASDTEEYNTVKWTIKKK